MAGTGKTFMLIAGEASGDLLASELVLALRAQWPDAKFFGAGGARMAAAGVELAFDMTQHAVLGLPTPGKFLALKRLADNLLALGTRRKPDAVIGVDYGGFNLRFGHAVKEYVRNHPEANWNPKLVQFVSPQVWASRPGRANLLAADYDLLLSIFPFEKDWYAKRVPKLRVEFVGHPMLDRIQKPETGSQQIPRLRGHEPIPSSVVSSQQSMILPLLGERAGVRASLSPGEERASDSTGSGTEDKLLLLLPGSRKSELKHHLPVMLGAWKYIQEQLPSVRARMVLPNEQMKKLAVRAEQAGVEIQIGNLPDVLAQADLAITKTGTVTMECAFFGVPAVTIYKKSFLGLAMALGIVMVKSLTMPNLMAGAEVYPEYLQDAATPENVAIAALELLRNEPRRQKIKAQLAQIIASLGERGANRRAAAAIGSLFP
jgi:lipid-A-disaccharide synthase